jgi:ELWxxDGT repeat protein
MPPGFRVDGVVVFARSSSLQMKKIIAFFFIGVALTFLSLAGCKVEITVPIGGNVITESGVYQCSSGKKCTIDVYDIFFDETFVAVPDQGFRFAGWKKEDKGFCGGKNLPCHLFTTGFLEYDILMAILESDTEFYLTPVFASENGPQLLTELVKGEVSPWNLIDFNDALYFTALEDHKAALWHSDATTEGTRLFKLFQPGQQGGDPGAFEVAADQLFFRGTDYEHGTELWVSDGTPAGTVMTKDIWEGDSRGLLGGPMAFKDGVLFLADDGLSGPQFWTSDGTEAGTRRFEDAAISVEANAGNFWPFRDGWLFKAQDQAHGAELWRTDGIEGHSQLVKDTVPGPEGGFSKESFTFAEINGSGVFWVWMGDSPELWRTDGTNLGTRKVWVPPTPDLTPHYRLISFKNIALFFMERSNLNDWSLWRTDGTKAGTRLLKEGFIDAVQFGRFEEYNGFMYMTLSSLNPVDGSGLWRTDGTKVGTQLVVGDLFPSGLTIYADRLYFVAEDGAFGEELYRTDGTAEGTELVADVRPGPGSSSPNELTVSQGRLFFHALEPNTGRGLYTTTSTP